MSFPTESKRLQITPLQLSDADFIFRLLNTEGWKKFIGDRNIHSTEDAIKYIEKIIYSPSIQYWVVRLKENSSPAGIVTFIKRDYLDHPDIGFAFLPEYSNQGYAFEAASAVLEELKSAMQLKQILATTIPENSSSIKLLHKLGLKFEKEIFVHDETLHVYSASL